MWFLYVSLALAALLFLAFIAVLLINRAQKRKYLRLVAARTGQSYEDVARICTDVLESVKEKIPSKKIKLDFAPVIFDSSPKLNADSTFPGMILLKQTWMDKIVQNDKVWSVALYQTVGHELGHIHKEPRPLLFGPAKKQFVNWVRECRADYYGIRFAQMSCEVTRTQALDAFRQKKEYAESLNVPVKGGEMSHPDWAFRYRLLCDYPEFDAKVVREIARVLGYRDQKVIEKYSEGAAI